ncbi:MAG: hypothetical protein EP330_30230 [Deltaproteobacteria bacterium]|nr:MAG: hypothetical protein EP330_30230 [Deltaproteobacteria bacterium]
MLALALALAHAAPCDTPWTSESLRALADEADASLDRDDMVAHARTFTEIRAQAECLHEPVNAEHWSRMLVSLALVEHALDRDWRAPLTAALTAYPAVSHQIGPDDIRQFPLPVADETHYIPVATDGIFFLDGRQISAAPPGDLAGPHLVQSYAEGTWETRYIEDEPYPSNWLSPAATTTTSTTTMEPKPRTARLVGGLTLGATGAAVGVATYLAAQGSDEVTPGTEATLKAANYGGWTIAGLGAALVTWHFVGGTKASAGPRGLALEGRF